MPWFSLRSRGVRDPVFRIAVGLLLWATAACGGDSTGPERPVQVAGARYELQSVGGAALPARYPDCDDPDSEIINARVLSGFMQFETGDRVFGRNDCRRENNTRHLLDFNYPYSQSGATVLIYSFGDDLPPDTATVDGNRLVVRAQFYPERTLESRVVLPMTYIRR